jgi:hypothetical protein
MRKETELFLSEIAHGSASFAEILLSSRTFVDAELAARYGVKPPDSGFVPVLLDQNLYAGILTQGSTLVRFANPARRGQFIMQRLFCRVVPPPPPGIDTNVEISPPQTRRQAWELHQSNPACRACHQLIDPIGFGFEHFDELGRYRATDNGTPVDASGSVTGVGDADGEFNGVTELASQIVYSDSFAQCMARTGLAYALERPLELADDCTVEQVSKVFASTHALSLSDLLGGIAQSHAFKYRNNFAVPDAPAPSPVGGPFDSDLARKRALLDFAIQETVWLSSKLPQENRPMFDQYLTSLRELEQQLGNVVGGPGPQP